MLHLAIMASRQFNESCLKTVNDALSWQSETLSRLDNNDPLAWKRAVRDSLEGWQTLSDTTQTLLNTLWLEQLARLDVVGVAKAMKELGQLQHTLWQDMLNGKLATQAIAPEHFWNLCERLAGSRNEVEQLLAVNAVMESAGEALKTQAGSSLKTAGALAPAYMAWWRDYLRVEEEATTV